MWLVGGDDEEFTGLELIAGVTDAESGCAFSDVLYLPIPVPVLMIDVAGAGVSAVRLGEDGD
jgi:hypothetical protein